jgi:hypothetical protein
MKNKAALLPTFEPPLIVLFDAAEPSPASTSAPEQVATELAKATRRFTSNINNEKGHFERIRSFILPSHHLVDLSQPSGRVLQHHLSSFALVCRLRNLSEYQILTPLPGHHIFSLFLCSCHSLQSTAPDPQTRTPCLMSHAAMSCRQRHRLLPSITPTIS